MTFLALMCFFGLDAAALPLHGNTLFCRSGNKLTNAGIAPSCTEESRAHTPAVEFYSAARIEPRRNSHKNTLDFTLTEVEQKEAGGVNWYDVTNPSSQQAELHFSILRRCPKHVQQTNNQRSEAMSSKAFHHSEEITSLLTVVKNLTQSDLRNVDRKRAKCNVSTFPEKMQNAPEMGFVASRGFQLVVMALRTMKFLCNTGFAPRGTSCKWPQQWIYLRRIA